MSSLYNPVHPKRDPDILPEGYNRFEYWKGAEAKFIEACNFIRHSGANHEIKALVISAFAQTFPICVGFIRQLNFLLELSDEGILI